MHSPTHTDDTQTHLGHARRGAPAPRKRRPENMLSNKDMLGRHNLHANGGPADFPWESLGVGSALTSSGHSAARVQ